jgi:hypothetical protein
MSTEKGTLVRIIVAGSEGMTAPAAWAKMAEETMGGSGMSRQQLFELDCDCRRMLHHSMQPQHWNALVAFYGIDANDRGASIRALASFVATPAHKHFKTYAIVTWAEPPRKGAQGRRSTAILSEDMYDMNVWDDNKGTPERTRRDWRRKIHQALFQILEGAEIEAFELLRQNEIFDMAA